MNIKIFGILIFILLFGVNVIPSINGNNNMSISSQNNSQDTIDIIINYDDTNGIIKPFSEINCGPLPNHDINGVDLTDQYLEVGITFVRTHDFSGPTDISTIFPDWSADPYLESSYDFTSSDKYISAIIDAGCSVFYRLGESASNKEEHRTPPDNFTKWAEICTHIVMHYNDGWNDGFNYDIKYFEIWNEPDLNGFWTGSAMDYYQLYQITAEKLKLYDPSLKIGGPCTSSIDDYDYTTGFLSYVTENNIPIDFFSWHQYADTPNQLYVSSKNVDALLESYGLTNCENINTEWNINILTPQRDKDNARNAAFTACCLSVFQDTGIDYVFRYRGTQDPNFLMRLIGFDLSLFTFDGVYKNPTLSYLAMNYLFQDDPVRLNTPIIDASSGLTYIAGKSEDNTNVSIIISNFDGGDSQYNLEISNLPWDGNYKVVHYLIDEDNHLSIIHEETMSSKEYNCSKDLEESSVHFIRLTNSSSIPGEGPIVAPIPFILRLKFLDPITRIIGIILVWIIFG